MKVDFILDNIISEPKEELEGEFLIEKKKNFICVIFRGKKRKVSAVCCKMLRYFGTFSSNK